MFQELVNGQNGGVRNNVAPDRLRKAGSTQIMALYDTAGSLGFI